MAKRFLVLWVCLAMATACTASVEDLSIEDSDTSVQADPEPVAGGGEDADDADDPADPADDGADAADDAATSFSVLAALAQIPESATDDARLLQVSVGDIEAAADQARLRPPLDPADVDDLLEFIGPLTGFSPDDRPMRVFVPFPARLRDGIGRVDQFIEEAGFSPGEVTSFVALESSPAEFLVLDGVTAPSGLPEVAPGVLTFGEGNDFEIGIDGRSVLRALGRPLRVGQQGDQLALGLSTPAVVDWLDGAGPTLADNPALAAVASRLDEEQVVSGFLLTREVSYRSVGLGWRADDRGPRGVIVLSYDSEATANAAFDDVSASMVGESVITGLPMTDLVIVEQIEVRGAEIVATVEFAPEREPIVIFNLLVRGDGPFAGS